MKLEPTEDEKRLIALMQKDALIWGARTVKDQHGQMAAPTPPDPTKKRRGRPPKPKDQGANQ